MIEGLRDEWRGRAVNQLGEMIHSIRQSKGFYEGPNTLSPEFLCSRIAHIHSEVSELYEAYRHGVALKECDKNNGMTCEEEELADIILVTLDLAAFRGVDIGKALINKIAYDETRPYRHDKQF